MHPLVWNADRTEATLTFTVRDISLSTIRYCVATWPKVELPDTRRSTQPGNNQQERGIHIFNVANGSVSVTRTDRDTGHDTLVASEPNDYSLNEGCEYDADNPSNTPFALGDRTRPVDVFIDANPVAVGYPEPDRPDNIYEPGDIVLAHRTSEDAMVQIRFRFYAEDAYGAEARRIRIASGEDSAWASLREIAVRDHLGVALMAASTTALLRGEARVSTSRAALTPGDGRLFVRSPDQRLQVHYYGYDSDGGNGDGNGDGDGNGGEAAAPKRSASAPQRRVSVEFANAPREPGDTVVFYISDRELGTKRGCSAIWDSTPSYVAGGVVAGVYNYWSLDDGAPFKDTFSLEGEGCAYDAETPIILPAPAAIMTPLGGQSAMMLIDSNDDANWRIALRNDVPKDSELRVMFQKTQRDRFPASARIARVYSSSDRAGEWVSIREVVSKTDASAAAASYLFRGEIEISADESSRAPGDGKVFVRRTSRLWVAYHDINNAAELGRKSQGLDLYIPEPTPTPIPTPIPAASRMALALAAAALIALAVFILLRRTGRNPPRPPGASPP